MNNLLLRSSADIIALVPAAGIGSRMNSDCPKQYLSIAGKTIIEHTLSALLDHPRIRHVVIVLNPTDTQFQSLEVVSDSRITTVTGGEQRADSVLAGLNHLAHVTGNDNCWVLVHDAARPCLHHDDLDRLLQLAEADEQGNMACGGILASPVRDTMKRGRVGQIIDHTVERQDLWHALTPQFFPLMLLRDCLSKALSQHANITDEASALEYCGYQPVLVNGRSDNIKVTCPEDLALAEFYLSRK
ncbi:2-C-methyl-D-erythritol 4-phosphate cytidylyltransferase [Photorhabdus laumondii subsp. laumondii]|uniref:2-C-methyl-D-erythritol 4-phosphate cytidylyltransferase n=2 Tax=Photorhabdus laumondii subsp. laumondii TaxID=141679 RepID=ISPD_PHOLL|nr:MULTISPECIES: 2-C-methyl-D-erythritol 4-phosphate cytidylyltransferase [Photorhabdus]Q7N8K7.1 RecName: Full=2-C-methyl-D-erythritol 4-phosphate cytidylyltransferase; AltName: Full=4-diphosphocytidyl-2C-methyl-D-erythritol synthase; AltName: Full=MEP cytidylyltransferase; Short=MCT [Photorhabdus laumondii subsp. laumondii TTO1]AWK40660.1 2-C-methyl-D-erythritol 4-phosphate cytidylyltransferase [Photorhabdus laumondii subsp. laumondii]AXG41478.1 2-C-methyl-D-erythritol 4-phosphate cytidylyltran